MPASNWRIGGKIDFTSANYSKRKDLRHTNYRLDLKVAPGIMYHSGPLCDRILYIFSKNSESVSAEEIGTAATPYYAFLDKGLMYGAYEAWSGSGVHLSESGINGFPIKELSHGAAVQVQWGSLYGDVEYLHSSGSAGEKEVIWFKFPAHRITSHLRYRFAKGSTEHFPADQPPHGHARQMTRMYWDRRYPTESRLPMFTVPTGFSKERLYPFSEYELIALKENCVVGAERFVF